MGQPSTVYLGRDQLIELRSPDSGQGLMVLLFSTSKQLLILKMESNVKHTEDRNLGQSHGHVCGKIILSLKPKAEFRSRRAE